MCVQTGLNPAFTSAEIRIKRFASPLCPLTTELDRELLSIVDNVLHPSYRELDRPDEPAEPEVEYQSRLNRVKSVCQKWAENGWYRANILPQGNKHYFDYKHAINRITSSNV